jgi:phage baseplate assembly protein gpV
LRASGAIDAVSSTEVCVGASKIAAAAGLVTVDAGMTRFSGVVQCDTLITNTVIAATYTPGAGNMV